MLKQILITIGIIIILIVFSVWVYLLIFGTPESTNDVFTDLGLTEQPDRTPPATPITSDDTNLMIANGLQQLTTRPIAGFIGMTGSSSNLVRYVEQGTGHIYQIDLDTQTESRLTGTTIPRTQRAVFSPDGTHVALTAAASNITSTFVGTIQPEESAVVGDDLPPGSENVILYDSGVVGYTLNLGDTSNGYLSNLINGTVEAIFSVSLTNYHMLWGDTATSSHYLTTKPARSLLGYTYLVNGTDLLPTPLTGYGLSVERQADQFLVARYDNGSYEAWQYNQASGTEKTVATLMLPEKCDLTAQRTVCAAPFEFNDVALRDQYPDPWYRGEIKSQDVLWDIQTNSNQPDTTTASVLVDLQTESGRTIDVTDLAVIDTRILFRNRIDNTLWLYE